MEATLFLLILKPCDVNFVQISGSESFTRWLAPRTSLQLTPKAQGLPRPEASWGLPRLEASWGLPRPPEASRGPKPPKAFQGPHLCYTRSFLGPQEAPRLLPLLPDHPWIPGTFLGPQKAPSLLPLLPAHSPCSQFAPLAPRASLGPWNLPGASWSPKLAPLAPSLLPSLSACSPCSQSIPGSLEWAGSKLKWAGVS